MGWPTGGFADKMGNRFEAHCVVAAALELIEGNATTIEWEGVGSDFDGIEYRRRLPDGTIECVQCKGSRDKKWTIATLASEGLLGAIRDQLTRYPSSRFRLVLASSAGELADLTERARAAASSTAFMESLSQSLSPAFERVREHWRAGTTDEADAKCVEWLSRVFVQEHTTPDYLQRHVETRCSDLFHGSGAAVRIAIRDALESRLGQLVTCDKLLSDLRSDRFKIEPRDWSRLPDHVLAVHKLRDRFLSQLGRHLIRHKLIPRKETETILKTVMESVGPQVVLVHGGAGSGKSGVLFETVERLIKSGICVVPLRLDNALPSGGGLLRYSRETLELPDTPDRCATRLAGGKRAVVVVDQLDAVRWAGVHSTSAWDVTVQLLDDAIHSQNVTVVVACRTFDIKDDPNLRNWRKDQDTQGRLREIEVKPLESAQVEGIIKEWGVPLPTAEQLALLCNPLMLWIWSDLVERGADLTKVAGASSLLSAHWNSVKSRLESRHGIPSATAEAVIARVREVVEARGRLDFSANIEPDRRTLNALTSESYLDALDPERFRVAHQRFLDHQIALSVFRLVASAQTTVAAWVASTDQSLARREQMRQLLAILRDDDPHTYAKAVHDLLLSTGIREHIRDLVLRLLAECAPLLESEIAIAEKLHDIPSWTRRIRMRCWTTVAWWRELLKAGHLRRLLLSEHQSDALWAAGTLRLLAETDAEAVFALLFALTQEHRIEPLLLARCLPYGTEHDTPESSRWRFRLQRRELLSCDTYDIRHAAKSAPLAALRFAAHLMRWELAHAYRPGLMKRGIPEKFDRWASGKDSDRAMLKQLAGTVPRETWVTLAPILLRSLKYRARQWRVGAAGSRERLSWDHPCRLFHRLLRTMLEEAATALASDHSPLLWTHTVPFLRLRSRTATRLCVSVIGSLLAPIPQVAIEWLLSDVRRLGAHGHSDVVRRFWRGRSAVRHLWEAAPECRERLSAAILAFCDPSERRHMERRREDVLESRSHLVPNLTGLPQYLLLSAIPLEQLGEAGKARLAQWDAKFCDDLQRLRSPRPPEWLMSRPERWKPPSSRVRLRSMRSLIPTTRLPFVSDRDWELMAGRKWATRISKRWESSDKTSFETPERLSDMSFKQVARANPSRAVQLARSLPPEARDDWFEAILEAASATEPEANSAGADWKAATAVDIERCLNRLVERESKDLSKRLGWLVQARPTEAWSDTTIARICEHAVSHPDPSMENRDGQTAIGDMSADDVVSLSINGARGVAIHAIERLMWHRPEKRTQFETVAEAAVRDPHPSVRVAAIGLVGPLLNDDPDRAIRLLEIACGGSDARVLYSYHLNRLLNYLWWRCDARVESIIERMTSCGIEKVEEKGAVFSTVIELKKSRMKVVAGSCARGNVACRRGVARALARLVETTPDGLRAAERLPRFFDDEDATVAGAAAEVFRDEEVMRSPLGGELAMKFARSSQFLRDPNDLMRPLADYAGDLSPFQPALAHVVLRARTDMTTMNRDLSHVRAYFADKAADCVLRIYERAQGNANDGVRDWCLDQIDALVSAGDTAIDGALKKLHSDT